MMQALLSASRAHRPSASSPWRDRARFPWRISAPGILVLWTCLALPCAAQTPTEKTLATEAPAQGEISKPSPAAKTPAPTVEQIHAVVRQLDDNDFDTRQGAMSQLEAWTEAPAAQPSLARVLQTVLLDPRSSFEIRTVCEPMLARLPQTPEEPLATVDLAEIDKLIAQTDSDSFNVRAGAAARLAWLGKHDAQTALQVAQRMKVLLSNPALQPEMRERLTAIWQTARGVWLASDPATWPRPDVSDAQLEAWVAELRRPIENKAAQWKSDRAERELFDLLAHDDQVARVRTVIERNLPLEAAKTELAADVVFRGTPQNFDLLQAEFEAEDRLERLHEWTKPAMVAEIWRDHSHDFIQYLQIGVPQYPEGTLNPRATHFDRIDEKTAHCESGNSLASGDYPLGVAIPPTRTDQDASKSGRMFHLINLSTPRRRLLYENYHLKRSEPQRLTDISERTTAWLLAQKRTLTEREILMLAQLDPTIVSRFIGPYLAATEDAPRTEALDEYPMLGRESRHALLCLMLAEIGTHECLPGLSDAIVAGKLPTPNDRAAYHIGWLAALAIADRDPWSGADDWLAALITRDDSLHTVRDSPPDVGATAAAMLLVRHGASISEFGLVESPDGQLPGLNFPLCRFNTVERRQQVLRWWKEHRPKVPSAATDKPTRHAPALLPS